MSATAKRWLMIALIVIPSIALDQITKRIAVAQLKGTPTIISPGDLFRLQYTENRGAFLGLGTNLPPAVRTWVFILVAIAIVAGLTVLLIRKPELPTWDVVAYALLMSGAVGNLIDRIYLEGRVVDFMNMGIGNLRTGIFNVADVAIMAGLFMLIATLFYKPKSASKRSEKPAET